MTKRWVSVAVLAASILAACGSTSPTNSPPSSAADASASAGPSASAPSAGESAAASPSPAAVASASTGATATPAPTASPAPTLVPFAKYTSKRYRYSIAYPPGWIVTPGTAKYADQIDDYTNHFVFISRDTVATSVSLSLTVSDYIRSDKSHYKATLLSNKAITVSGWHGRLLVFNGAERSGRKVLIQRLILAKGRVGYFVDMFSDRAGGAADKALFKKIYSTFKPKS